ncbi:MAG: hypothetical protein OXL33_06540 [Chloroflexota bacterium]|nr:hypothetical protein [Chloroflexota bacterium]
MKRKRRRKKSIQVEMPDDPVVLAKGIFAAADKKLAEKLKAENAKK